VQNLLGGCGLESVTESVEIVTESKAEPIEDIRRIVERWGEACAPSEHQRPGQAAAVVEVLGDVAGARPGLRGGGGSNITSLPTQVGTISKKSYILIRD